MFDNIGWLMYAYTRLDVIHHALVVLFAISVAIGAMLLSHWAEDAIVPFKRCVIAASVTGLLLLVVPTKQDALLIYGVTTGVAVVEKTIDVSNKSELAGKVLQIVEGKIDNMLEETKKGKK